MIKLPVRFSTPGSFGSTVRRAVVTAAMTLVLSGIFNDALAVPRFTLLSGSRCSNCHFNPQGSGIRNEFGWMSMNESGALGLEKVGLGGLKGESNTYFNDVLTLGLDGRLQYFKTGRPPFTNDRFIPMQLAAHAAVVPFEQLSVYGGYNFSALRYTFPGQSGWTAAVQYQPSLRAPSIRAGYIQPSIGVRNDDHTFFIRREAAVNATYVIPPDYSDLGAELTYEGLHWITANAGVFDSRNLMESERTIDSGSLSYAARLALWPQLLSAHINGMLGASLLANGDFTMINVFGGLGFANQKLMLYGEAMFSNNAVDRQLRNFSFQTSWEPRPWLALSARYEMAQTETAPFDPLDASAVVVGAEFFPIPFLEFRPEYRYYRNDSYSLGQFAFQIHAFY